MSDDFQRILVIVTRQLGDVLLTTPLIRAARRRWPQARIEVLGFAGTLGLLKGNSDIDALIEVPPGSGWRRSWPLIRSLWRRYDLALIGQPSDRAHLYGFIAGRRRSGLVTSNLAKSGWYRLHVRHAVEIPVERDHVVLEKLALLEPWCSTPPEVSLVTPAVSALPAALQARLRPGYVVVQVPSLVEYKQWPLAHFGQLIDGLVGLGRVVVLTGSASPADRRKLDQVWSVLPQAVRPQVVMAAGELDLAQMTALVSGASLYIGPDTSITHLAAGCGVPVIALYGPVDPRIFGPWPSGHPARQPWQAHAIRQTQGTVTVLQGPQACVPCNGAGCDGHNDSRSECLVAISAERVLDEARRLMRAAAQTAPDPPT